MNADNVVQFPNNWRTEPWLTEPNIVSSIQHGFHLLILRHEHNLNLNGYVGVPRKHPLYGKLYMSNEQVSDLYVHGGITFSGYGRWPEFQEELWYFGFDTAHFMDYVPGLVNTLQEIRKQAGELLLDIDGMFPGTSYRDINYVAAEVNSLYEQLKKIQKDHNMVKYKKKLARRRF